ncbi:MAG: S8 family serine peptidase, partial [Firmicutes bacterium]|nr:S8 family serine peptidase [Bacillota bacterium]
VISMSLGSAASSSTLENAVNYAWNKGVLIVAAAGNSNGTTPLYPAYYQNCIAVAATDRNDAKAGFSSYGSWVDVAAPGVDIFSTVPNHKNSLKMLNYGSLSGTSMAAPHVAGIAALIYNQVTDADNDGFLNDEVRLRLESTADKTGTIWSDYGIPRVNAYAAVGT